MGRSSKAAAAAENCSDEETTTDMDASESSPFSVGDMVLASYSSCLYEAKVLKIECQLGQFSYLIHYHGWKKSYDEWRSLDDLLTFTEENSRKQEELFAKHGREKIMKPGRASMVKHMSFSAGRGKKRKIDRTTKEKSTAILEKLVHIQIPSTLKKQLVVDCEFITHMGKLVKLPRDPNVDGIMDKYLEYRLIKDGKIADSVAEIVRGLRCYFDKSLPAMLLYKNERQQYQAAIGDGVSPAALYGAEHLLRLFVKLPEILYAADIEEDTLKELQQKLLDFLKFLQINRSSFFMPSYQTLECFQGSTDE